jgi:antitoxin (DNA-binding transcriptional repressor) of toxin-antitoxin stability system
MKQVELEQLPPEIADLITSAQHERVVVTRSGEPYALVVGVENKDEEDLQLEFSPGFWRMIEDRRRGTVSVPLKDVIDELETEEDALSAKSEAAPAKPPTVGS